MIVADGVDGGEAVDAPDSVDAGGAVLLDAAKYGTGKYCPGDAPNLPHPGDPCKKENDIRCTNYGAHSSPQWTWNVPGLPPVQEGLCFRPNRVRCAKGTSGAHAWQLEVCTTASAPYHCIKQLGIQVTCQENSKGVSCCPIACLSGKAKGPWVPPYKTIPKYTAKLCSPLDQGYVHCSALYADSCGFLDDTPSSVATNKWIFTDCKHLCQGCTYFHRTDYCLSLDCPKAFGKPPQKCLDTGKCSWPPKYSKVKCYYDKSGTPKCPKTCKEAGAPGY